ncbi:hypothetical protein [Bradyrhizobium sp. LTSPM299]|uniref:hypothetical protein n=1 Tax=Bradyrhizobium sp. LTSPM299 TaxID=1619233 RepID=UPI0012E28A71|nr:hypothetical protein [Bradyrhizobium sp. LTSPM299]
MSQTQQNGSRNGGQHKPSAPRSHKDEPVVVEQPPVVVEHKEVVLAPQPHHQLEKLDVVKTAAEQLKSLAPMMGREGAVIVAGSFPAHAAVMAGANPAYVYGSAIIFAVLYMIQTWRHP